MVMVMIAVVMMATMMVVAVMVLVEVMVVIVQHDGCHDARTYLLTVGSLYSASDHLDSSSVARHGLGYFLCWEVLQ